MTVFGFSRANHIIECNGKVKDSTITSSSIDMNGAVITSHSQPINDTDVVNKEYVDEKITTITVTLTGISYSQISSAQSGVIDIHVKNIIPDGPSASFNLVKSSPSMNPGFVRFASCAGDTTGEKLKLRWSPGSGIEIRKTGLGYDGDYKVRYTLTTI